MLGPCETQKGTYGGVGDFAVLHRDIEVHANEHAFACEVKVGHSELVGKRHCDDQE